MHSSDFITKCRKILNSGVTLSYSKVSQSETASFTTKWGKILQNEVGIRNWVDYLINYQTKGV